MEEWQKLLADQSQSLMSKLRLESRTSHRDRQRDAAGYGTWAHFVLRGRDRRCPAVLQRAAGTLLDELETGTLGRLIGSRLGMSGVLSGKWMFLALMGILQLTVMFTWGALVFHLPLASHLPGFFVMTLFTASAAAAFGLLLATLCRTRAQLSGISTIVILAMSAVGGSMFPRFLMSETMQKMGLVTFNAWALDGYIKVFWREAPIVDLWPQVLVLTTLCAVFLTGARLAARRWETL